MDGLTGVGIEEGDQPAFIGRSEEPDDMRMPAELHRARFEQGCVILRWRCGREGGKRIETGGDAAAEAAATAGAARRSGGGRRFLTTRRPVVQGPDFY